MGYAALAVEGVLLFRALVEGSATALILAILVAAAALIYFLKPHPMARKLVVVGAMVLPLFVFAGWYWGLDYYQQSRANAAAESQAAAFVKEHIPEQWQREHPGGPQSMVFLWNLEQDRRADEERAAEQAKQHDAEEKARAAARPKIGDRVWVPNNDSRYLEDRIAVGVAAYDGRSRLYGTIVDIARGRYAVKRDCGACKGLHEVVWHNGDDLNLVSRKPDTVKP